MEIPEERENETLEIFDAIMTENVPKVMKVKVAQSCPTLCNPMDCISVEFSTPEYWSW